MKIRKQSLNTASRQWAVRPADQRFWTLEELLSQTKAYAMQSLVLPIRLDGCTVEDRDNDLLLSDADEVTAEFQHYSFGQLCTHVGAPAAYLRELPAYLAAANLNEGLAHVRGNHHLMFHQNGGRHLRCITSAEYARIWNWEVAELALALQEQEGWVTPPARPCGLPNIPVRKAVQADVLRKSAHPTLGIKVGDDIAPAGLYASDHDCFIFQVNENRAIESDGETMYRGVIWQNSEVGECKWRGTFFLYDSICGNHIIWGAKVIADIAIRHTGKAREMFAEAMAAATSRIEEAASDDLARVKAAKQLQLGEGRQEVVEVVFRKNLGLSRTECDNAYVLAERHSEDHGNNPDSAWGYAAGLTRLSQGQFADKRNFMDRAAGKILEMAIL